MASPSGALDNDTSFIPLINFTNFLHGPADLRQMTATSLLHGFQTAGFIYLTHHPIPLPTISHAFATSASFFRRPQRYKDALGWTTPEANRGYVSHGREKVSSLINKEDVEALKASSPDLKESFEIGREGAVGLPNNWPQAAEDEEAGEFKRTMLEFFELCKEVHIQVMRAIAVGMRLEEGYFDTFTDGGDNTLRLLHYPAVSKDVFRRNKMQVRAGEHTDYGSITLLFQDNRGGLQVKRPDGTFVDARPIEGSIVVNAGDLLARWSNDTIRSTLHRVVEPSLLSVKGEGEGEVEMHPARYSIAYFCNPNFDKRIEAIEGTYNGEKGERKYEGINSGEYLVQRLAATY